MECTTSTAILHDEIPTELRDRPQWVCWREVLRDGRPNKVPYATNGIEASSTDQTTWTSFSVVTTAYERGGYSGIGYVFSASDPFIGIDLDGCRDPESGTIDPWAAEIIDACDTYAEVSPSGTGVKLIGVGKSPFEKGKNQKLPQHGERGGKAAGIEVYDHGRYFTVTGWRLPETDREPCVIQPSALERIKKLIDETKAATRTTSTATTTRTATRSTIHDRTKLVERCRKYIDKKPAAISQQGGHGTTYNVACTCFKFGLTDGEALEVLGEYNARCEPPWSDWELQHKLNDARDEVTRTGEFGIKTRDDWQSGPAVDLGGILPTTSKATAPPADDDERNEPPAFTKLMTCGELLDADLRVDYLIPGILVAKQPCVIGGLPKACKTTTMVDLAISLGTGTKFLDEWQAQKRKVGIWSGESGAATLRNMAVRIARSKGVELRDASLLWSFDLPKLARHDHLTHLERTITANGLEVVVVDPLYLSLLDAADANNASNVYAMGAKLQPIGEIGQRTGCTFVVLHHFKRSAGSDTGEPASLEMLSQSGIVEWARQWILLQRRSPYQSDGRHELWLRAGGSAGHAGLWAVDADEGVYDPESDVDGRRWEVVVKQRNEAIQEAQAGKDRRRQESQQDRQATKDAADVARLATVMKLNPDETKRKLRDEAGLSGDRVSKALLTLLGTGHAERITITKNDREEDGYRYIECPGKVDLLGGLSGFV